MAPNVFVRIGGRRADRMVSRAWETLSGRQGVTETAGTSDGVALAPTPREEERESKNANVKVA